MALFAKIMIVAQGVSLVRPQVCGRGRSQKEYYLREQLNAIKKELGESDDDKPEFKQLKERLESIELPEEGRVEVERELSRLERAQPESQEAQVIRTFLETVAELPWGERSEERLDQMRVFTGAGVSNYSQWVWEESTGKIANKSTMP